MKEPLQFTRGYNDASAEIARKVKKAGGSVERARQKVEADAMTDTAAMLGNIEYCAGKVACWRDAELQLGSTLTKKVASRLREIADMLEAQIIHEDAEAA